MAEPVEPVEIPASATLRDVAGLAGVSIATLSPISGFCPELIIESPQV